MYTYIPTYAGYCDKPDLICDPADGISMQVSGHARAAPLPSARSPLGLQRGAFTITPGGWHKISVLASLNKAPYNIANGVLRVWYDGKLAIDQTDALIRTAPTLDSVSGLFFSTFFGGSGTEWAPGSTQHAYFKDIKMAAKTAGSTLSGAKVTPL